MMTYKEKLVMFVKLKKDHIKKFGFVYVDHKDYEDIRSWDEERCKKIYDVIMKNIMYFGASKLTEATCPWCLYTLYGPKQIVLYNSRLNFFNICSNNCSKCYYGKRYGECMKLNSVYKKCFTDKVKKSLTNKVYQDMINKIG